MANDSADFPFVRFAVNREYLGEDGLWNPRDGEPPLEDAFQVNVFGRREHYLRLAEALRALAERDTSAHAEYHEHFEGLRSAWGNVRVHLILRKDDVGDGTCQDFCPPP